MGELLRRAYATFEIKSIEDEARVIRGIASTPEPDRMGDVLDPMGASYALPLPLLWQHRADQPIGTVTAAKVTKAGIEITASIAKLAIARIDEAWSLIKGGLVRGLSVGFRPTAEPELLEEVPGAGWPGFKFSAWEWLELSAVTIPANQSAGIVSVKSLREADAEALAAIGRRKAGVLEQDHSRGGARASVIRVGELPGGRMKKSYSEQVREWENTRRTAEDRRDEILSKFEGEGVLPDEAAADELEELDLKIKKINAHIVRLRGLEADQVAAAKSIVAVADGDGAARARDPKIATVQVRSNLPVGQEFARMVICRTKSFLEGGSQTPAQLARMLFPDTPRVAQYFEKAAVPAGGTINQAWAGVLVDPTNLSSEFLEFVRPATIVGQFGTGGIPSLVEVPFNSRITGQTGGGAANWVGQGAAKPVTQFAFDAQVLLWTKLAAISVLSEDLIRFSSPAAETLVRNSLRDAIVERLDRDFIDPAKAAVAAVSPASVTNGVAPMVSAGTSADAIRADIGALYAAFAAAGLSTARVVLVMPETLAVQLALMRNPLGQAEFPTMGNTGGTLEGLKVIASQYAIAAGKNIVVAVNAPYVLLADDKQVTIDASREASIEMSDAPAGNALVPTVPATVPVSMFQTNCVALRAERYINWAKARAAAVQWINDVKWGALPATP